MHHLHADRAKVDVGEELLRVPGREVVLLHVADAHPVAQIDPRLGGMGGERVELGERVGEGLLGEDPDAGPHQPQRVAGVGARGGEDGGVDRERPLVLRGDEGVDRGEPALVGDTVAGGHVGGALGGEVDEGGDLEALGVPAQQRQVHALADRSQSDDGDARDAHAEPRPEGLTVGDLLGLRLLDLVGGAGHHILLDDEPAVVPAADDLVDELGDGEIALAQGHEDALLPHRSHRVVGLQRLAQDLRARILQVQVVDAVAPPAEVGQRVAASDEEVPGVEGESDVGRREQGVDLFRGLDVGARVVMERGLETAGAHSGGRDVHAIGEPGPVVAAERELGSAAGSGLALGAAGIGERGQRCQSGAGVGGCHEDVEDAVEVGQRALEVVVVTGEGQIHPPACEFESVTLQALGELVASAEESDRTEVDALVAGLADPAREFLPLGESDEIRPCQLEDSVAHRRIRDTDHSISFLH